MKMLSIALMFALAVTPPAFAHEGHDQKIMGTVSAIEAGQLTVKATTGQSSTVLLNDKTKVLMGSMVQRPRKSLDWSSTMASINYRAVEVIAVSSERSALRRIS